MYNWNPSSDDEDAGYAGFSRRRTLSPRGSALTQTPPRAPRAAAGKETLTSPGPPPMFQMGSFVATDEVFAFQTTSPKPDPDDVSFSLSKPECTRRTIEKADGGSNGNNAYIITRRGDRPHTPYTNSSGGKHLDSEVCKVQRASRGFNFPVGANGKSHSRSQSLSHAHSPSDDSDRVHFAAHTRTTTTNVPNAPAAAQMQRGTIRNAPMSTATNAPSLGPTRRVSTQGKVDIVASRGRNRSLQSNQVNASPVYDGDDLETMHM